MYYNIVHHSTEIHSVVVNLLLVWLTRGHARSGSLVSIIRSGAHACISVCVVFCPVWLENSSSPSVGKKRHIAINLYYTINLSVMCMEEGSGT